MKFTKPQLEAIGYLFERANGNALGPFEEEVIVQSNPPDLPPNTLADAIVSELDEIENLDSAYRTATYWALSKRFDKGLVPRFRNWLRWELEQDDTAALYQLMIALDNLEEPVFSTERSGYAAFEVDLNLRDANDYLKNLDPGSPA